MKDYFERFFNDDVDEIDSPEDEKCIPGGCKRKMCINGAYIFMFVLLITSVMVHYNSEPEPFVYLVKTTDINKFSAIKAAVVDGGLLVEKETGCLEKLILNPNQNLKQSDTHVLCSNFTGSCTKDTKK